MNAQAKEARKERSEANLNWNNTITELQVERERSKAFVKGVKEILAVADDIEFDTAEEFRTLIAAYEKAAKP